MHQALTGARLLTVGGFNRRRSTLTYWINNARSGDLADKATFRDPWKYGKRCIIPAEWFDEPCGETGGNVWWRFRRADGDPWGLASLWNTWIDKATGEVVESQTMLTLNADAHPLMSPMHKPDPKFGPDEQDKRSAVPIGIPDVDQRLFGTVEQASKLVLLVPAEVFDARPAGRRIVWPWRPR